MTQHNIDLSQYGIKAPAEIISTPRTINSTRLSYNQT